MENQSQMTLVVWSRLLHHVLYVVSDVSLEMQSFTSGTLSIHEAVTIPRNMEAILYRKASCECLCCLSGNYNECVCLEQSQEYLDLI